MCLLGYLLGNAYSNAVFENTNKLTLKHVYEAIKNSKSIYEDAKKKGLTEFKEVFSDIISKENINLD